MWYLKPVKSTAHCLLRPIHFRGGRPGLPAWGFKTGGLLTQGNYRETCTLGGWKGRSLNTGGLKDRFDCISKVDSEQHLCLQYLVEKHMWWNVYWSIKLERKIWSNQEPCQFLFLQYSNWYICITISSVSSANSIIRRSWIYDTLQSSTYEKCSQKRKAFIIKNRMVQ